MRVASGVGLIVAQRVRIAHPTNPNHHLVRSRRGRRGIVGIDVEKHVKGDVGHGAHIIEPTRVDLLRLRLRIHLLQPRRPREGPRRHGPLGRQPERRQVLHGRGQVRRGKGHVRVRVDRVRVGGPVPGGVEAGGGGGAGVDDLYLGEGGGEVGRLRKEQQRVQFTLDRWSSNVWVGRRGGLFMSGTAAGHFPSLGTSSNTRGDEERNGRSLPRGTESHLLGRSTHPHCLLLVCVHVSAFPLSQHCQYITSVHFTRTRVARPIRIPILPTHDSIVAIIRSLGRASGRRRGRRRRRRRRRGSSRGVRVVCRRRLGLARSEDASSAPAAAVVGQQGEGSYHRSHRGRSVGWETKWERKKIGIS